MSLGRIALCLAFTAGLAAPGLGAEPPQEAAEAVAADAECDPEVDPGSYERHDLGGGAILHILPCALYAYNYTSRLFVERAGLVEPVIIEDYGPEGWAETQHLFGAYYETERDVLTSFYKGRGIGDCGTYGQWSWTGETFRLEEMHAMSECEGMPPDEWPRVYP